MTTQVTRRRSRKSLADNRLRSRAESLLAHEVPCVFSPELKDDAFTANHRQVVQEVLSRTQQSSKQAGGDLDSLASQGWSLPDLLTPDEERSLFVVLNAARWEANSLRARINPRRPAVTRLDRAEQLLQEADAVRSHLCEANVRLVMSVAGKMADAVVAFDDLFGEGLMILLKAIDGFDFSKGFRFSTYATNALHRHFFRLRKRTLRKRQFGMPVEDDYLKTASLGEDGVGLAPDDPLNLTRKILRAASRVLDQRERKIVELRFGLDGSEHTLREIAAVLKVSKERVRQVLARAVGKLQDVATNLRLEWTPRDLPAPARLGV